jgi:hypothetical protein
VDHLGDVGRVIADTLEIAGDEQQFAALLIVAGFSTMKLTRLRKMLS